MERWPTIINCGYGASDGYFFTEDQVAEYNRRVGAGAQIGPYKAVCRSQKLRHDPVMAGVVMDLPGLVNGRMTVVWHDVKYKNYIEITDPEDEGEQANANVSLYLLDQIAAVLEDAAIDDTERMSRARELVKLRERRA